jgi:hypothetical protein
MVQPGKMQEVAQAIMRYKTDIRALQFKIRKGIRHTMGWLDDVGSDLKKIKVKGCKEKMRDRGQWRLVAEEVKAIPGL